MSKNNKEPKVVVETRDFTTGDNEQEKAKLNEISAKNAKIIVEEIENFQKKVSKRVGKAYMGGAFVLAQVNEVGDVECISIANKMNFVQDPKLSVLKNVAEQLKDNSEKLLKTAEEIEKEAKDLLLEKREKIKKEADEVLSGMIDFYLTPEEKKEWEEKGYYIDGVLQIEREDIRQEALKKMLEKSQSKEDGKEAPLEMKRRFIDLVDKLEKLADVAKEL